MTLDKSHPKYQGTDAGSTMRLCSPTGGNGANPALAGTDTAQMTFPCTHRARLCPVALAAMHAKLRLFPKFSFGAILH